MSAVSRSGLAALTVLVIFIGRFPCATIERQRNKQKKRGQMQTVVPDPKKLKRLPKMSIDKSSHTTFEEGHCAMELVSWLAPGVAEESK